MGQTSPGSIVDIGESKEAYLFRVVVHGVRTDVGELICASNNCGRSDCFLYGNSWVHLASIAYQSMDTWKNMTSRRKPVRASFDDQLFLLNFIICSYIGPDVYSDEWRCSWFERFAKSSPPYTLANLGGSFLVFLIY